MVKKVLVTGASGYLAWELIHQLSSTGKWEIFAMSRNIEDTIPLYRNVKVTFVSNAEVLKRQFSLREISCIVHTAFCRESKGNHLVNSLEFTEELAFLAGKEKVECFLNMSSQSVYGAKNRIPPKEDTPMNPDYLYSMAKCASEILLNSVSRDFDTIFVNVRLASLIGPSYFIPKNILYKFMRAALAEEKFHVIGGTQQFSFLDVRDASAAIVRLMELGNWRLIYNLGPSSRIKILDMADLVCEKVKMMTGMRTGYLFTPSDEKLIAGLDSEMLYRDLGWKPEYSFANTVEDTLKWILEKE